MFLIGQNPTWKMHNNTHQTREFLSTLSLEQRTDYQKRQEGENSFVTVPGRVLFKLKIVNNTYIISAMTCMFILKNIK